MKIFSENSGLAKWGMPLVGLVVIGCFLLGLIAARFGNSAQTGHSDGKLPIQAQVSPPVSQVQPPPAVMMPQVSPASATEQPDTTKPRSTTVTAETAPSTLPAYRERAPMKPLPDVNMTGKTLPEQHHVFGQSVQGRSLVEYILGNGANKTIIFGDFHGNERSVPGVVNKLHQYLTEHPEQWPNCTIVLVPYANPDGWAAGTRVNANHVDINRNFIGTWKPVGRAARYNPGPHADSEPETRAIENLVKHFDPTKIVSIHQPLHMLNWTGMKGEKLAAVMHNANGYPISNDVGYATPGSFGDYCGGAGIAIVTMELPNEGVSEAWASNRKALLAAINTPL